MTPSFPTFARRLRAKMRAAGLNVPSQHELEQMYDEMFPLSASEAFRLLLRERTELDHEMSH